MIKYRIDRFYLTYDPASLDKVCIISKNVQQKKKIIHSLRTLCVMFTAGGTHCPLSSKKCAENLASMGL